MTAKERSKIAEPNQGDPPRRGSGKKTGNPCFYSRTKSGLNSPLLDSGIKITSWTKLHHLAPMLAFILYQVDGLHNIRMVQRRGDAKFSSEFLDILLLRLVFSPFPEFLLQVAHHLRFDGSSKKKEGEKRE